MRAIILLGAQGTAFALVHKPARAQTGSAVDQIEAVVAGASCAKTDWNHRGIAPLSCLKGLALAYTQAVCFGLVLLTLLSACSPYVYKDGITKFSTDVTSVLSSDRDAQSQVAEVFNAAQEEWFAAKREPITTSPPNCIVAEGSTSSGCKIVAINPAAEAVASNTTATHLDLPTIRNQLYNVGQLSSQFQAKFAALNTYVTNLAALTNAGDQTAYDTAVKGIASSVADGVKSTSKNATDSAVASAVTQVVGDIGGLYLEDRRYNALKKAVTFWDTQVLADIASYLSADLSGAHDALISYYNYELIHVRASLVPGAVGHLSEQQYRAKYEELQTDITAYNKLTSVDPTAAVKAMVAAHHSLAQALQSAKGQFSGFQTDLDTLSKDVSALQSAFSTKATSSATSKLTTGAGS
jgi:hypothetical protein